MVTRALFGIIYGLLFLVRLLHAYSYCVFVCWWRLPADCGRQDTRCMPELVCRLDQPCSKHHALDASTGIDKNAHCCGEILRWCAYALASVLSNQPNLTRSSTPPISAHSRVLAASQLTLSVSVYVLADYCESDSECPDGSFCSQQKLCIKYTPNYCKYSLCGLGDSGSRCMSVWGIYHLDNASLLSHIGVICKM